MTDVFAASADRDRLARRLAHLAIDHGACEVTGGALRSHHEPLSEDARHAIFHLRCRAARWIWRSRSTTRASAWSISTGIRRAIPTRPAGNSDGARGRAIRGRPDRDGDCRPSAQTSLRAQSRPGLLGARGARHGEDVLLGCPDGRCRLAGRRMSDGLDANVRILVVRTTRTFARCWRCCWARAGGSRWPTGARQRATWRCVAARSRDQRATCACRGFDGIELLRALRAAPATHDVPVILVSARAGERRPSPASRLAPTI